MRGRSFGARTATLMLRIAFLTLSAWRGRAYGPQELPEEERQTFALLAEAGSAHGLTLEVRHWDDPSLTQAGFDAAIVRSCWDYIHRCDEFLERLDALEAAGVRVFNPAAAIRWNARKTYLRELGDLSIPTLWSDALDASQIEAAFEAFDAEEIVVKPQVGAAATDTVRLKRGAWNASGLAGAPRGAAMLQPYLRAIETEGELSLLWLGDAYSHAVRKVPRQGSWFAGAGAGFHAETPDAAAREVAAAARAKAPGDLLYLRVDLIRDDSGAWRVMELEAIEPHLFLDFAPEGAALLARGVSRVLAG